MNASDIQSEPEMPSSAHGQRDSVLRRLWRSSRIGLPVVLVIELLLLLAPWAPTGEDYAAVNVLSYVRGILLPVDAPRYSFVDIDDAAFSLWEAEGHTKRVHIRKLLQRIANSHPPPKAIVVDIDLSDLSINKNDDRELIKYVNGYAKDQEKPPLVFVQTFRPQRGPSALPEVVPWPFDASNSHSLIYFGSAGFLRSSDGKVRSWLLAEAACKKKPGEKDQLTTIPSVELLLLPILEGQLDPGLVNRTVQQAFTGDDCSSVRTTLHEIRIGEGSPIRLSPKHLRDPIVYTIAMPKRPIEDGSVTQGLRHIKAEPFVNSDQTGKDARFFGNVIVVIGGSNSKSRDTYNTPLGEMPGAVVLTNAIESVRLYQQLRELNFTAELICGVAIGMLVWLGLESVRIEIGLLPVYCVGYPAAVLLSIVLLYFGIWFSVSGVIAGGLTHIILKAACNIWRDVWKEPHNWLRAFLAKES